MTVLDKIKEFAIRAHGDQRRKFEDAPYYVHLFRVMDLSANYTKDIPQLAAALLHDVLEDTSVTSRELSEFLHNVMSDTDAKRTHQLVVELTDIYTKSRYPHWNRRRRKQQEALRLGAASAEAQTIKYADIIDNSESLSQSAEDFAPVYLSEAKSLLQAMQKGDPTLREKAMNIVDRLR